ARATTLPQPPTERLALSPTESAIWPPAPQVGRPEGGAGTASFDCPAPGLSGHSADSGLWSDMGHTSSAAPPQCRGLAKMVVLRCGRVAKTVGIWRVLRFGPRLLVGDVNQE